MDGDLKLRINPKKDFSIITLCNNNVQYHEFLESLKTQKTSATFEIICLPNYNNEYKSCSEALNVGLELAHGTYQILCHQDLVVPDNWIENIFNHIKDLNTQKTKWGVLGMAGSFSNTETLGDAVIYLHNDGIHEHYTLRYGDRANVGCLDELALITRKSNIRFDERLFDHYHWYGADICLQYMNKGYENFAINAPCVHKSSGNANLYPEDNRNIFIKQAAILMKKWRNSFPNFRTTTSYFDCNNGLITFYIAETMKKEGYRFPPQIKVS
jgi:hypothetical protein